MSIQKLYTALSGAGMPVAYRSFITPQTPPFIVYLYSGSDDFYADNENYVQVGNWQVELYTQTKDISSEQTVEKALKEAGFTWAKYEAWLDEEDLLQILYLIQSVEG